MRKLIVPLIVVVAIVAVAIPSCQMIGCTMPIRFMPLITDGVSFTNPSSCGGAFVFGSTPSAVVPSGADSLMLTLVAALAIAAVLFAPRVEAGPLRIVRIEPPPPPEDPRGERFLV
jgi:hypothetical protein